jgi:hypothetical protein
MHGTVVSYDSATGVMVFDANQHTGSGTFSNWEVNVGGVNGAILPVDGTAGQVLAKIDGANFNTEWISLGNVALNNYATTAQAQAGTSTTTVISPSTLLDARYLAGARFIGYTTWTASTSGTGATAGTAFVKVINAPTSAIGFGQSYVAPQNGQRGEVFASGIDFRKTVIFGGRFCRTQSATIDSNSIFRSNVGRAIPLTTAGDLSTRGIGIRIVGDAGVLELQVHNGTTLYNVASSFTPVYNEAFDVVVISDGAGNATLYVNGSSVATSANAPTTLLTANSSTLLVECQNTEILTNARYGMSCSDQFLHVSPI